MSSREHERNYGLGGQSRLSSEAGTPRDHAASRFKVSWIQIDLSHPTSSVLNSALLDFWPYFIDSSMKSSILSYRQPLAFRKQRQQQQSKYVNAVFLNNLRPLTCLVVRNHGFVGNNWPWNHDEWPYVRYPRRHQWDGFELTLEKMLTIPTLWSLVIRHIQIML